MHTRITAAVLAGLLLSSGAGLAQPAPADAVPAAPSDTVLEAESPRSDAAAMQRRLHDMVGRPGGLTADEVARRAAATSRVAAARDRDAEAAEAEVDRMWGLLVPRVGIGARYARLSAIDAPEIGTFPGGPTISFPVILDQYGVQASLTVPVSEYLVRGPRTIAASKHSRAAARHQARATRLGVAAEARVLYYNWVRSRLRLAVAEQSLLQAEEQLRTAELVFQAGRASSADVLRAESLVAGTELMVERARNAHLILSDQVRTAMHDAGAREYEVGEDVTAPSTGSGPETFEVLYAEARRRRVELRALDAMAQALGATRSASVAGNYPRLEAFANGYYANPSQRIFPQEARWKATWDAGVQLTWAPTELVPARSERAKLDAQIARLQADRDAFEDGLRAEVLAARQSCLEAQTALRTTERALRAAEEGYRARRELFRFGKATTIEVIDAETNLLAARIQHIDAQVDLRIARSRLDHATGRDGGAGR